MISSDSSTASSLQKRSRKAKSHALREVCNATCEHLEQRWLLSSTGQTVGINFDGGYQGTDSNGNPMTIPGWDVRPQDGQAGVPTISIGSGATAYTLSARQGAWNNAVGTLDSAGRDTGSGSMSNLLADNFGSNVTTGMSVTWSAGGTWAAATNSPADGQEELNTGFLFSSGTATPIKITVSNVPYAQYDVVVYELNDAAGRVQTTTLNGFSYYGSSPDPHTSGFAPSYLLDSDPGTQYYYAPVTSSNPNSPTANADYVVFPLQGGSTFTLTAMSPGNGFVNGIQIVDDETVMAPKAPVQNPTISNPDSVVVNWNPVLGKVTYNIQRKVSGSADSTYQSIATGVTGTTFTDSTADATGATTYTYEIQAVSPLNAASPWSNPQDGFVNPAAPPQAPQNLTAVANPNGTPPTITLNWTPNPLTNPKFVTGYVLQRSTDYGQTWSTINPNSQQITGTSFVDSNVQGGVPYLYRVAAINDSNSSDISDPTKMSAWSNTAGEGWNVVGTGDGWSGYYYSNINGNQQVNSSNYEAQDPWQSINGSFVNSNPVYSRVDPTINVRGQNEANAPPGAPSSWPRSGGNPGANFSATWKGYVQPPNSGSWTFYGGSDDGIEVDVQMLDGSVVRVDNNVRTYRGYTEDTGSPVTLIGGQKYLVTVYYHEGGGGWDYTLRWSGPNQTIDFVPSSQVYSIPLNNSVLTGNLPKATGLNAVGADSQVTVGWTTTAADGYNIYRWPDPDPNGLSTPPDPTTNRSAWTKVGTVQGTGTSSFTDTSVTNGTWYWYFVTGLTEQPTNGTGLLVEGPASGTAKGLPGANPPAVFSINNPSFGNDRFGNNALAINPNYNDVNISWGSSLGAIEYHVYRNTSNSFTGATELPNSPLTGTSYTDSTAKIGQTYFYFVTAQNGFGVTGDGTSAAGVTTPVASSVVDLKNGLRVRWYNYQFWKSYTPGVSNGSSQDGQALISVNNFGAGPGITPGFMPDQTTFTNVLNQDYGSNPSGGGGINSSNVSALYTGKIHLNGGTNYTFTVNSDDDGYVWVNGQLAAAYPFGHGLGGDTRGPGVIINVPNTGDYPFEAAMSQGGGGYGIHVKWSTGSGLTTIPATAFTSSVMPTPETPDAGMVLQRWISGGVDQTVQGSGGVTPYVTLTFVNDNVTAESAFLLERADVSGATTGSYRVVGEAGIVPIGSTGTIMDNTAIPGATYTYRLRAVNFDGSSASGPSGIKDPRNGTTAPSISMGPVDQGVNQIGLTNGPGSEVPGVEMHFYNDQWWGSPVGGRNGGTNSLTAVSDDNFNRQGGNGANTFGIDGSKYDAQLLNTGKNEGNAPIGTNGAPFWEAGRNVSGVFTGKLDLDPAATGATAGSDGNYTYSFITNSDDDNFLFINGKLVSSDPTGHGMRNAPGSSGVLTPIVITPADLAAARSNPLNGGFRFGGATHAMFDFQMFWSNGGGGYGWALLWKDPNSHRGTFNQVTLAPTSLFYSQQDVPAAPTAGAVSSVSNNNRVTFNFVDNSTSEVRYVLERATNTNFTDAVIATQTGVVAAPSSNPNGTGSGATVTLQDQSVPANGTFYYRIRAENFDGVSPWAVFGGATPTAVTTTNNMPAVTGLSVRQAGSEVHLFWSNNNNPGGFENGFVIQRATQSDYSDAVTLTTTVPAITSYYDLPAGAGGVSSATTYYYRVATAGTTVKGVAVPQGNYATGSIAVQPTQNLADFSGGFTGQSGQFQFNQTGGYTPSITSNGWLRMTNSGGGEGTSAFLKNGSQLDHVNNGFSSTFDFQFTNNSDADGFAFILQPTSNGFRGGSGGGLGANGGNPNIGIYFNLWQNVSQTGLYLNGGRNTTSDLSTALGGNVFHNITNGATDTFHVVITYDPKSFKLTESVTDKANGKTYTNTMFVPVLAFLHTDGVYAGFTAGTGGATTTLDIKNWVWNAQVTPIPTITGTAGNDNIYLKKDADGSHLDYWLNSATPGVGTPTGQSLLNTGGFDVLGAGGNDVVTIDQTGGDILNSSSANNKVETITGGNLTLNLIGTSGNDAVTLDGNAKTATIGGKTITTSGGTLAGLGYTSTGGTDALTINGTTPVALNVNGGTTTLAANTGTGIRQVNFSSVAVGAGAKLNLASSAAHANRTVVVVPFAGVSINATGLVDVGDNDLIIQNAGSAGVAATQSLISAGSDSEAWDGTHGITSSKAQAAGNTALGFALNDGSQIGQFSTFDGVAVGATDVVVKYTYQGDADLNGVVNGDDYFYIDSNYPKASGSTWVTGDFDYNGVTNGDDYFYIDSNYLDGTGGAHGPQL